MKRSLLDSPARLRPHPMVPHEGLPVHYALSPAFDDPDEEDGDDLDDDLDEDEDDDEDDDFDEDDEDDE